MAKGIMIGEALIDFMPREKNIQLKDVTGFDKAPGGAPANVAACVATLGEKSKMISKLGMDAFGDYLVEIIDTSGVDTSSIYRTNEANTALAFVSLKKNGEREFSFYRKPSADLLLSQDEIKEEWFEVNDILHFCSVDLVESPVKYAHIKAIEYARKNQSIICFDPNIRLPLWSDKQKCIDTIHEFIPYADILKVSDEELELITGFKEEDEALQYLLSKVKVIIYTMGARGSRVLTKKVDVISEGIRVNAIDTTGAGDSYMGAIIYQLLSKNLSIEAVINLSEKTWSEIMAFANATAAIVVQKKGAISAMPTFDMVQAML